MSSAQSSRATTGANATTTTGAATGTTATNSRLRAVPRLSLPGRSARPLRSVLTRVAMALAILWITVALVYFDRGGYRDSVDPGHMSFIDCLYYATVTLSTTGYGDIVPASEGARLVNALVITPLRVLFLIILVGTTLEVLTERTRQEWRQARWRKNMDRHTVIVGFGTKGRSTAATLLRHGTPAGRIVVIDTSPGALAEANAMGLAGVLGDGTRSAVLAQAETDRADTVVIATQRDDSAVLTTLTARQLNPRATIVAAVREAENAPLVRQSGADTVITSADTAGQLLGVSSVSPQVGQVVVDLLSYGQGMDIAERAAGPDDVGRGPRACLEPVLAVIRGGRRLQFDDPGVGEILGTDRLIVVQAADAPGGG
jgi:voltage-gated potassium channel